MARRRRLLTRDRTTPGRRRRTRGRPPSRRRSRPLHRDRGPPLRPSRLLLAAPRSASGSAAHRPGRAAALAPPTGPPPPARRRGVRLRPPQARRRGDRRRVHRSAAGTPRPPGAAALDALRPSLPRSGRDAWSWLLGLLVVVLVGATAAVFVATRDSGPHYPKAWDSRILPIVQFDEHERGLQFKHPVEVLFMAPKAFDKLVTTSSSSLSAKDKAQIADETASLRALGLIDGGVDLFKQENDLNSGGILAYYDPHDKKVRVKGSELTPDVRVTLAHELTHALQDQYFDLGREDSLPDDAQQAFRSVVEGDAVVVQNAYAASMSQSDQDAYNKAESDGSSVYSKIPDILVAQQLEPYVVGPAFVNALKAHGGDEAVDEALRHPPASTAALMDIFRYLDQPSSTNGSTTTTMAVPKLGRGDKKLDSGDFGALYWYLMLARRLDVHKAIKSVDGWAGDSSLTYREAGRAGVRHRRLPRPSRTRPRRRWPTRCSSGRTSARTPVRRSSTDGDVVHFKSCDPGTHVTLSGTDRSSDVVEFAAARVEIAEEFLKEHMPNSVAECSINGMFGRLSLDDVIGIDTGSADAALQQKAQRALASAVASCH